VKRCLAMKPEERITIKEIETHSLFEGCTIKDENSQKNIMSIEASLAVSKNGDGDLGILDAGEILDNPRNESTQHDSYRHHAPTILVNSVLGNHSPSGQRRANSNIPNSKSYAVKELHSEYTPVKNKPSDGKLAPKKQHVSSRIFSFVNIEDSRVRGGRLDNSQSSKRLTQSP
jgi:serine/threonine protein kinase